MTLGTALLIFAVAAIIYGALDLGINGFPRRDAGSVVLVILGFFTVAVLVFAVAAALLHGMHGGPA